MYLVGYKGRFSVGEFYCDAGTLVHAHIVSLSSVVTVPLQCHVCWRIDRLLGSAVPTLFGVYSLVVDKNPSEATN